MRTLAIITAMLLSAAIQAQTVDICDRTPEVREAILDRVNVDGRWNADDCEAVDARRLTRIESLHLAEKGLTSLRAGDFEGLAWGLRELHLGGNQLTTLPEGVFEGLSSLQILDLEGNRLTTLPEGVFERLASLQSLYLDGNELTELPDGVFNGLDSLGELHLGGNQLTTLPEDVFEGLSSLSYLQLSNNRLTTLPVDVFEGLGNLESLLLEGNRLTSLPEDVFDGLSSLWYLYLGGNRLTTLPAGVFEGLRLLTLALQENRLTTLPEDVFDGLGSLRFLYLHDNHLVGLTRDDPVFEGLSRRVDIELHDQTAVDGQTANVCGRTPEVRQAIMDEGVGDDCASVELAYIRELNFAEKGLTSLQAGDFKGLTRLQRLYLQGNRLTSLPEDVFEGLTRLQRLRLDGNELTELPDGVFEGLSSLEYLQLNNNHLVGLTRDDPVFEGFASHVEIQLAGQGVPPVCDRTPAVRDGIVQALGIDCYAVGGRLADVEALHLGERGLTELREGDFAGFSSLETLSLNGNRLTSLPEDVFEGLTRLQRLRLHGNQLATLPEGVFEGLASLQSLDLHGNQLATLPAGVFEGLASLQDLSLHENRLTSLPADLFDGLDSLTTLFLYDNQLSALPEGLFDGLDSLENLWLGGNQLTSLPDGVFNGLDSLGSLHLYGNQLTTLPEDVFEGLSSLWQLRLGNNRLTTLPERVFEGLSNLSQLRLHGNHLVGLSHDDPLFAAFSSDVDIWLDGQTTVDGQTVAPPPPPRTNAAVPLMLSNTPSRQGFVRIVNESNDSGSVRVFAVDDGGNATDPFELQLGARQVVQFNSNDLENGNANKGIEDGVGNPVEGDWRLDVATALPVRVLSFVRHADGFLTAMHDVLPRTDDGRLAAHIFNPGRNLNQASRLRLVNTGENDAPVSIEGVDDGGNTAGPVTLTLQAGESRTLSAAELESGALGLSGTLGTGAGKWRLFITAGSSVVGMSLLESANGNLTNISTSGMATSQ